MIQLDRLTKAFGSVTAVDGVSMEVPAGAVCVLLGPSGCGKTTTMKMINRLIVPSSGKIFIDGKDTSTLDAVTLRRSIGYVIQQIGLFPNKTIEDNICIVPDLLGWDRKKSRKRAAELLELVNLDPATFLRRYPKELSGGQQQRVGVVRALAADPPVLLMDEPFGAIDPINREVIQDEFMKLQAELKKTVVFVSHDIDEAVKMASHIAIFRDGKLIQFDKPDNILASPIDNFVADFVGSDRTLKRLRLVKVSEAMQSAPPSVVAGDTIETAISKMESSSHNSIVMVGPQGRARAFLQLADIRSKKGSVGDHAEALPGLINVNDDLRNAVSAMFSHGVTWLACVDDEGFYKGYVTQRGISQLLGAGYHG
ncbi:betaine/proline/choline family ABC transporter ATP-binding protein [Agrobacterium tumefaciens]|uniref:ABC transporter ATP-binding protein n=1 Tax=Agrobacterium tumefaciens TaxID=358 RepID=UPI001571B688|nr:ABC transporter ATP-binding protein [Agrobacterium tumefaciens]NTB97245.1 betaine/proline/choline family ABC transporter ATP-binding protein [Agrobacterium tumefaciens]NTC43418.1 betaine/proline/choline family ABC transporter ATP-binding protein [Agrobacterium tumefaciens]